MSADDVLVAVLAEWAGVRWNTRALVEALGDPGLRVSLPRPGLDSFCKHVQEMIAVQEAYVRAIRTGRLDFSAVPWNDGYDGDEAADSLLARMAAADAEMVRVAQDAPPGLRVEWPEDGRKTLPALLITLCAHEMLHVGQLVAFCYATDTPLPQSLIDAWALSPQTRAPGPNEE